MNIFKLRTTDTEFFTLAKSAFEQKTSLKEPWLTHQTDLERHFAACPDCNDSTQVIQLYGEVQARLYCPYYTNIRLSKSQNDQVTILE